VLLLFDQAISGRESAAHAKLTELLARKVPADAPTGFVPVVCHPLAGCLTQRSWPVVSSPTGTTGSCAC